MSLWLAVGTSTTELHKLDVLGVSQAKNQDEAFYKFMQMGIYPEYALELPETLTLTSDIDVIKSNYDKS